jgi:hypothetical protein
MAGLLTALPPGATLRLPAASRLSPLITPDGLSPPASADPSDPIYEVMMLPHQNAVSYTLFYAALNQRETTEFHTNFLAVNPAIADEAPSATKLVDAAAKVTVLAAAASLITQTS